MQQMNGSIESWLGDECKFDEWKCNVCLLIAMQKKSCPEGEQHGEENPLMIHEHTSKLGKWQNDGTLLGRWL